MPLKVKSILKREKSDFAQKVGDSRMVIQPLNLMYPLQNIKGQVLVKANDAKQLAYL
jgi:hypothetical protein